MKKTQTRDNSSLKKINIKQIIRLCVLFFLCFGVLLSIRLYVNHFTTGDEPHYLLMDYSLKNDGDLNLKNNYENNDYLRYYPEQIIPHVSPLNINNHSNGWYSIHGIGLPILVYPAFLIAEKVGPMLVLLIFAALLIVLSAIWTYIVTQNRKASAISALVLLSCYFFNGLAGYIYPDIVISVMLLGSFIIIGTKLYKDLSFQFMLGVLLGLVVFMHFRFLAATLPIGLYFLYKYRKTNSKKLPLAFLIPWILLGLVFFITLHGWFGVWLPNQIYPSTATLDIKNIFNAPAILFDSLRGIFVYNPILLLIPIGLPLWWKKYRESFYLLLLILPIVLLSFGFREWHGGYSPTGRYFIAFIPFFMPSILIFYIHCKSYVNRLIFWLLFSLTAILSLIAIAVKQPYVGYSTRTDIFVEIQKYTHISFDKYFPTYNFLDNSISDSNGKIQAVFWMTVLALLVLYGVYIANQLDKKGAHDKVK